jgi:hypothetical protein
LILTSCYTSRISEIEKRLDSLEHKNSILQSISYSDVHADDIDSTKYVYVEVNAQVAYIEKVEGNDQDDYPTQQRILYRETSFASEIKTVRHYSEDKKYRIQDQSSLNTRDRELVRNDIEVNSSCYRCKEKAKSYVTGKKAYVFDSYKDASIHRASKFETKRILDY